MSIPERDPPGIELQSVRGKGSATLSCLTEDQ